MELESFNDNLNLKKALKYFSKLKNIKKQNREGQIFAHKSLDLIKKINNKKKFKDIILDTEQYCNNYIAKSRNLTFDEIFSLIKKGDLFNLKNNLHMILSSDLTKNNNDGITPLHYCVKVGDTSILKELLLKDISINTINSKGNTLIEYACLCNDPNMIHFLSSHGAMIQKSLFIRDQKIKIKLKTDNLDIACISKLLLINSYNEHLNPILENLKTLINLHDYCGFGDFTINNIMIGISKVLSNDHLQTYANIIKEELSYNKPNNGLFNIFCYNNQMELIIYNLVPFINYEFNISQENVYLRELYFLKKKFNNKELINILYDTYIEKLVPEDFIGIQIKKLKYI